MNIILIVAIIAAFYNVEIVTFNQDYLSKQQTNNLKGIFIVVVLFHHLNIFAGVGECFNIFTNAGYMICSPYGRQWKYPKIYHMRSIFLCLGNSIVRS